MVSFKCKQCGGEMSVDEQGKLYCEYCGSKEVFKDADLREYREFRTIMLQYLRGRNEQDQSRVERIWDAADELVLRTMDGTDIMIRYIYCDVDDKVEMYVSRHAVIYIFKEKQSMVSQKYERGVEQLCFPAADMKGLERSFPKLTGTYTLEDGRIMMTLERRENVFPLSVFGSLEPRHAAWIVSRLENICCVLEYSQMVHGGIDSKSVFIDPFTHEAVLYGGWWNVTDKRNGDDTDLRAIRRTAEYMMGTKKDQIPEAFQTFLKEKPKADAYQDFAAWDRVIEVGFGGRKFAKMDMSNTTIM